MCILVTLAMIKHSHSDIAQFNLVFVMFSILEKISF